MRTSTQRIPRGWWLVLCAAICFFSVGSAHALNQTWTSQTDWNKGKGKGFDTKKVPNSLGIFYDPNNQQFIKTPYMYVPNSGLNTVVKVAIKNIRQADGSLIKEGQILWTFNLSKLGRDSNPSRTTVDGNGNVWVGMRNGSYVYHISSEGKFLGRALVRNGAQPRGIVIDRKGFVWAGAWSGGTIIKIDPRSYANPTTKDYKIVATITGVPCNYGLALDADGNVWSSARCRNLSYKINTTTNKVEGAVSSYGAYGIAGDKLGNVWIASWEGYRVYQYRARDRKLLKTHYFTNIGGVTYSRGRGIAVGPKGDIWIASSYNNRSRIKRVVRIYKNGGKFDRYQVIQNVGWHMIGLGVDAAGFIWGISYDEGKVYKIDVKNGSVPSNFVIYDPTGKSCILDVNKGEAGGLGTAGGCVRNRAYTQVYPYTYSDITSFQLQAIVTPGQANWSIPYDPKCKANFGTVTWNATLPANTKIQARARTAASATDLGKAGWKSYVDKGKSLGVDSNNWIEVEFKLSTKDNRITPLLADATISYTCFPNLPGTPPATATEDKTYTYKVPVTDRDPGDTHKYTVLGLPKGAKFDAKTGTFTWTPGDTEVNKTYTFEVRVCDKYGNCTNKKWSVKVANINDLPVILTKPGTTATEDSQFTYTPKATDVDLGDQAKLRWKLKSGPFGLKVDPATGKVTWTPGDADVAAGKRTVTVEVCDPNGGCRTQTWVINVRNINDKPLLVGTPGKQATEKKEYSYSPKVQDPDPNDKGKHKFKLTKGPKNAKIDPNTGKVTWTPDNSNVGKPTHEFEIEVCDPQGACSKQKWTVSSSNVNDAPTITSKPGNLGFVGKAFTYPAKASDPDPNDVHTWRLVSGGAGAKIDPKTGALTWTPGSGDAGKDVSFEIEVCDDGTPKKCAKQSFKVKVFKTCQVDNNCGGTDICIARYNTWVCVSAGCAPKSPQCSAKTDFCKEGSCAKNPCDGKKCGAGEICRPTDGKCIKPCAGVTCNNGEKCEDGACVKDPCAAAPCSAGEICDAKTDPANPSCVKDPCAANSCRHGRACMKGHCVDNPCGAMTCPDKKQRCVVGQCTDRKDCSVDIDCGDKQICLEGKCYDPGCYTETPMCGKAGENCQDGVCKEDPCRGPNAKKCNANEFCRSFDGKCVGSCASVTCPAGDICVDGKCAKDPCASVTCNAGEVCVAGKCVRDRCVASGTCRHKRICNPNTNSCQEDPCKGVKCPNPKEVCRLGQCQAPPSCQFDKDCPGKALCLAGKCVNPTCTQNSDCKSGEICINGQCKVDGCAGKQCPTGQYCKAGQCVGSCAGIFCPKGEKCVDGLCGPDACANKNCPTGETCVAGQCVKNPCGADSCKAGRSCTPSGCKPGPCANIKCPTGQQCSQGQCGGDLPCKVDSDCPGAGVCLEGICAPPGCYQSSCSAGSDICLKSKCGSNPCDKKNCSADESCRASDGKCMPKCPTCESGEVCNAGKCEKDPCDGVSCNNGERCDAGKCVKDVCKQTGTRPCKYQRVCSKGACQDDPCLGVKCGNGETCNAEGICVKPKPKPEPEPEPEPVIDAGTPEPTVEATPEPEPTVQDSGATEKSVKQDKGTPFYAGGGCGCSTGSAPTGSFFLFALFVLLAIPRRRRK